MSAGDTPFLYDERASWWHLFSPPSHYVEEAKDLLPDLLAAADSPPRTLLELGAGAGSLAYHLKDTFQITLTDRAPRMLEVSRNVNPECEHILGDMKRLDLRKVYDLVLVHDAIMYAADRDSLATVLATAYRHLRPGGGAVFVPDYVQETFEPTTKFGGDDDRDGRGLRYLQWTRDPNPADSCYEVDWAFVLRDATGSVQVKSDHHQFGLFPRAEWLGLLSNVGSSVTLVSTRGAEMCLSPESRVRPTGVPNERVQQTGRRYTPSCACRRVD